MPTIASLRHIFSSTCKFKIPTKQNIQFIYAIYAIWQIHCNVTIWEIKCTCFVWLKTYIQIHIYANSYLSIPNTNAPGLCRYRFRKRNLAFFIRLHPQTWSWYNRNQTVISYNIKPKRWCMPYETNVLNYETSSPLYDVDLFIYHFNVTCSSLNVHTWFSHSIFRMGVLIFYMTVFLLKYQKLST